MGKVYIVGAGPGDDELITLKGWKILEKADVILYDRLVGASLIDKLKKKGKKLIYVGKKCGERGDKRQAEINKLMREFAEEGYVVARLKGGDPLIFGRLGDEIEYLSKHGVPYEIIPGVSSVNGVPACFSIPLTHPEVATSLVIITGKERMKLEDLINKSTFVVLMGRDSMKEVARNLIEMGVDGKKKVAIIQRGTFEDQEIFVTELQNLQHTNCHLKSPVLILIGDVLELWQKNIKKSQSPTSTLSNQDN